MFNVFGLSSNLIPSNLDVKICGLQKGKEQLILISEYYDTKATSVSFKLNALENCQAIDMLTGEKIASIVKGNNVIHVLANSRGEEFRVAGKIYIPKIGIKELDIKSLLYISYPGYFGRSSKYNKVSLDSPSR